MAGLAIAALAGIARAQNLPRLHVLAIDQRADRLTVAPHEQFHVTIRVAIGEKRERLDELVLGDLENCTIVGDERLHAPLANGTEFTERLTLEGDAPGTATVTPAHLDAIDPASGRPLRYSAKQVIHVTVTSAAPIDATFRAFVGIVRTLLLAAGAIAALVIILIIVFALRARQWAQPPVPAPAPAPALAAYQPPSRETQLAEALRNYRVSRSQEDLLRLRGLLFEFAGVDRGATLADALRKLGSSDASLRFALSAAERAAFGPAGERERAGDELLNAVEAYSARAAAKPRA
jgi:hypothetical protein